MPNWCSTTITIRTESPETAKNLMKLLEKATSKNHMENGFGHGWLGNVVLGLDLGTVDTGTGSDLRCRGCITYLDACGDDLIIDTETAWTPMLRMWRVFLERYAGEAEMIFTATEPGCAIFVSNDPDLVGTYEVDTEADSHGGLSGEEALHILRSLAGSDDDNMEVLSDILAEKDIYCSLRHYREAGIDDFD